jgi:hypothetical protein
MRQLFLLFILTFLSTVGSFGQNSDTTCFSGMNINSNSKGVILSKSLILLERIQNPSSKQITINILLIDTAGRVTKNPPMVMMVEENNDYTVAEAKGIASGKGKLFGPPWNWISLSGEYKTTVGVTIKDQSYFSDPSVFTSRKEIILPNGNVLLIMDIAATRISRIEYEILTKAINTKL